MNTAIVTISREGYRTAERVVKVLGGEIHLFVSEEISDRYMEGNAGITIFQNGVKKLTSSIFSQYENLIFIMPLGIVIRAIAPHIRSKYSDPAVVAVDIPGRWVISVLSGHEGGANSLAETTARALNTAFVVTTSTEARKNLILGVGCKKNIDKDEIEKAVDRALQNLKRNKTDIRLIVTVERKSDEPGILQYCRENGIPLRSISVEEIKESRIRYRESKLVRSVLGVGGVAVPCALLGGQKTKLIMDRIICGNVTVAAALENLDW